MHSTETKHQFITLRARGLALAKISEQLNTPKSTLGRWQSECEEEIQQLQRVEWEEIEAQFGYTLQDDLRRIMKRMRAAEDQLDARSLERFTRRELFQLIRESRREYEKKRALLLGTPKRDKMVRPPTTDSVSTLKPSLGPSVGSDSSLHRTENPSEIQPFPHRNERGTASGSMEGGAPPRHEPESEIPNQPSESDTGANSIAGKFITALHRLQLAETDSPTNSMTLCSDSAGSQSEIPNPKSKIESVSAPLRPCVESSAISARAEAPSPEGSSVETQNPAKTQPFTSQDSGGHNSNLSPVPEGRAMCPHSADPLTPNHDLIPPSAPSSLCVEPQSQIENPESEIDFGGESLPVSPYEPTRVWLERQGIKVSKIPKGARIITAG